MTAVQNTKMSIKEIVLVALGSLLFGLSVNLFITPLGLYNGGLIGLSQIIRSVLIKFFGMQFNFDIAGILNFTLNIPLFILAYKNLSKKFLLGTIVSLIVQTITITFVPIPTTPILNDYLASCALGALIGGVGCGMMLTNHASGGGIDILGMYLSIKKKDFSVGKMSLYINTVLYIICAILFELPTAVYSVIYVAIFSYVMDKTHLQNIEVSLMIFTRNKDVKDAILHKFVRGVTYWVGQGAYTNTDTEVLVTIVSKYEVSKIKKAVTEMDPKAFIIMNENTDVTGGYEKRLV